MKFFVPPRIALSTLPLLLIGGAGAIAGCDAPPAKAPPGARMGTPAEEAAKLATVQKAFEERQKMRKAKEQKAQTAGQQTPPGQKPPPTSPK